MSTLDFIRRTRSFEREKMLVQWLDSIKKEAAELYLLGDIFDFWHEYRKVVPRGFTRFLGKLAEMSDNGTKIHFFTGNHDVWVYDYLPAEIGLTLYRNLSPGILMASAFSSAMVTGLAKVILDIRF